MKRISQIPGLDAVPAASPMGAEPGMPGAQQQPANTFQVIYSPLDSLGKILADLDFKTFLQNHFGSSPHDLAMKIWTMYGGSEDGMTPGKKGARKDTPQSDDMTAQSEAQQKEYNATRNQRWKHLYWIQ